MDGYDVIGDVHGCADKLRILLGNLGYESLEGAYRHPRRTAIFVGDLIDRGSQQVETLEIVRAMIEAGTALIVMGNHEFNAISYATVNPEIPGEFMRPHSDKNRGQHRAFTNQVQLHPGLYATTIDWFRTWPVYLDLEGIRVVHACWNVESINTVNRWIAPSTPMSTEFVIRANQRGTAEYEAIETLLKGPELSLTKYGQMGFMDKEARHVRHDARVRWWDATATTLRELAEIPPNSETPTGDQYPELPDTICKEEKGYDYCEEKPVLYGHYWRWWEPKVNQDWTSKTACVDFSAVRGGPLVAYRWTVGEREILPDNYVKA